MQLKFFRWSMIITGILSMIFGILLVGGSGFIYYWTDWGVKSMQANQRSMVKQALTPMFYKDGYRDYLPVIDETQGDVIGLPVGVTPDLISRFIVTQAAVQEKFDGLTYLFCQAIMVCIVVGIIGVFSILFGFVLIIIQVPISKLLKNNQ